MPPTDSVAQLSEVRLRSGNSCQNVPPPNSTSSSTPSTKPGIAKPTSTMRLVATSNFEPLRTAFAMPSGTDIRYVMKNVHKPMLIDTGSFDTISDHTL